MGANESSDATEDLLCYTATISFSIITIVCWAILLRNTSALLAIYVAVGLLAVHLLIVSPWVVRLHAESTISKSRNRTTAQVCAELVALLVPIAIVSMFLYKWVEMIMGPPVMP